METKWTIYCHIHTDSGRRYVGLTKTTMLQRWNRHVYSAMRSSGDPKWHFANAICKYGKDAFSHEVLEVCNTLDSANTAEEKWIEHFKTQDSSFGFNLTKGGSACPHSIHKNPWDRPEYRAKVISSMKLAKSDPIIRNRMSLSSMAIHARLEVKNKMSLASKRMWGIEEYKNKQASWYNSERFRSLCIANGLKSSSAMRSKTHCINGHEYSKENTRMDGSTRVCRTCHRDICRLERLNRDPQKAELKRKQAKEYMRKKRSGINPL